nr:hypothetical protein CFP56_33611 [Quercus suber]
MEVCVILLAECSIVQSKNAFNRAVLTFLRACSGSPNSAAEQNLRVSATRKHGLTGAQREDVLFPSLADVRHAALCGISGWFAMTAMLLVAIHPRAPFGGTGLSDHHVCETSCTSKRRRDNETYVPQHKR